MIPDGVFEIFYSLNPSGRSTVLASTQSVTEMVPGIFPWGGGAVFRVKTLLLSCADFLKILGASIPWSPRGAVYDCKGTASEQTSENVGSNAFTTE